MDVNPSFDELLPLITDRSAVLRSALAEAPDLDTHVPGCPDWSLYDLVAHVGEVQRFWAAVVSAGPSERPPAQTAVGDIAPRGDLLVWLADSTEHLIATLRTAGPQRECWTWRAASGAPLTAGAVARHQVREAAVHAYDAQATVGRPEPVPTAIALDSVAEFLTVSYGTSGPWPHRPARVGWHTGEGPSWCLELSPHGAGLRDDDGLRTATVHGTASDLLLALQGRIPLSRLGVEGDRSLVDALLAWPDLT